MLAKLSLILLSFAFGFQAAAVDDDTTSLQLESESLESEFSESSIFEPWVGLGLGFMDENEDLKTKGYPLNLKFVGSFEPTDFWVLDTGVGMVSQAFQNQSEKDIAISGLVDLGARVRLDDNWQAGPQLKTYVGDGELFGSSSDIFTTFVGAQLMRQQNLWDNYKTRAGVSVATDIGIPNQTAFVTSLELQIALGSDGAAPVVLRDEPANVKPLDDKTVFFDLNQKSLAARARADLNKSLTVQERLQAGQFRFVEVIGYADSTGPTGLNLLVSKKRAEAVERELLAMGIPPSKIRVRWVGEAAAPRDQLNTQALRKVEVKLID